MVAKAAEKISTEAERLEKLNEMERSKTDLWDFVPGSGLIWGGNPNQFEDLDLAFDRYIEKGGRTVITSAEEQACCSLADRASLEAIVRCGIEIPMLMENPPQ
jgi:hypothetical protein